MAAPKHPRGFLWRAIRWIRTQADERSVSPRFTNAQVLEFLQSAMDEIIDEVYGMADAPQLSRFNITLVEGQGLYMLPCDLKEFHRASHIDTTTGLVDWEFLPRSKYAPGGPGIQFEGNWGIRWIPTPTSATAGEIITIEYVPGGHMLMHQGITAVWSGVGDTGDQLWAIESAWSTGHQDYTGLATLKLEHRTGASPHNWFMGEYDHRPNAFIGQMLRILGTHDDVAADKVEASYLYFPLSERVIKGYDNVDRVAWVEPAWDIDALDIEDADPETIALLDNLAITYVVYEIIPLLDRSLWWLASLKAALEIAALCKRKETVTMLNGLYKTKLRSAQLRWANMQLRSGDNFDSTEEDFQTDDMF